MKCGNGHNWTDNWGWTPSPVFNFLLVDVAFFSITSLQCSINRNVMPKIHLLQYWDFQWTILNLWKASFPPVVDKHSTTSTAWNSPLSRTTYTHNWHSKHDGVENASPFKYGYVTMLGIYGKFQGYLTWDKEKRGQFSTIQRSNMQDPSTRPRPPLSHMGDSSTSKSKRSFIIGRLANRLLRLFGNAN